MIIEESSYDVRDEKSLHTSSVKESLNKSRGYSQNNCRCGALCVDEKVGRNKLMGNRNDDNNTRCKRA